MAMCMTLGDTMPVISLTDITKFLYFVYKQFSKCSKKLNNICYILKAHSTLLFLLIYDRKM